MTTTPTPIDVTPKQLAAAIDHHLISDVPMMIWGNPGLGKSQILESRIRAAGFQFCDFRAAVKDLPDLQGYPILAEMRHGEPCPMTAPADLPPMHSPDPWGLVFEELPNAARMMQGGLYGLVNERRLNAYHLPKINRVFATGNPASNRGANNEQPPALRSRFRHYSLILCPDEILAYATGASWHPYVLAYHHWTKGAEWSNFDPKTTEETYSCPRSWEHVSRTIQAGAIPADLLTPMMAGSLGYGIGQKFASFVRLYHDLAPTLSTMRIAPDCCPIPDDAAIQWFFAAHIAADKAAATQDPAGFARFAFPFLTRLPDELCVFAVDTITKQTPQLARTPEFRTNFATNPRYAALAHHCK